MTEQTVKVYVRLPEEGSPTIRPTQAIVLGNEKYKLLATKDYDPEDEVWEFLPNTIVKCEKTENFEGEKILLAIEKAQ